MKPKCYGTMFPTLNRRDGEAADQGRVFGQKLHSLGIGQSGFDVLVNEDAWEHCTACEQYRTCYDLSLAKFELAQAAR